MGTFLTVSMVLAVTPCQMCSGKIGTYSANMPAFGLLVWMTSVFASVASTLVTLVKYW